MAQRPTRTGLIPAIPRGTIRANEKGAPAKQPLRQTNQAGLLKRNKQQLRPAASLYSATSNLSRPAQKPEPFTVYVDENTVPNENNVIRQIEKIEKERVPLASIADNEISVAEEDDGRAERKKPRSVSPVDDEKEESSLYVTAQDHLDEECSPSSSLLPFMHYSQDILTYMLMREKLLRVDPRHLKKQPDLSADMRAVLFDWLHDVVVEYNLEEDTFHLAVSLVDRLLSLVEVSRPQLQLAGTGALLVASKVEDIYPPEIKELIHVTDETYNGPQIMKMERRLLNAIGFDVVAPTARWFSQHLAETDEFPQKTLHLVDYIVNLSTLSVSLLNFLPSVVASSAVCLANRMTERVPWPARLSSMTGYSASSLRSSSLLIIDSIRAAPTSKCRSIYERFQHEKLCKVAELLPPDSVDFLE